MAMPQFMSATYYASYDDYNGSDIVPCVVDIDKMEVVSFDEAEACRWYEDAVLMCVGEEISLNDGRSFDAIKFNEYNDAINGGYDNEYDRENIILFDAEALADACHVFVAESEMDAAECFNFQTCKVIGSPTVVSNASTAAMDVQDAAEHMKRAIRTLKRSNTRVSKDNMEKWPGFYDDYLEQAAETLELLENMQLEVTNLAQKIRLMG